MNGRERLTSKLQCKPAEGLAWAALVDDTTRSIMPQPVRELSPFDFYKYIGCDILQFGNYGLNEAQWVADAYRWVTPGVETEIHAEGETIIKTVKTSQGDLVYTFRQGHPLNHPVKSIAELRILKKVWQDSYYQELENGDGGYARIDSIIGGDGVYVPILEQSPVQQLLEYEAGPVNFYYLLQDYPREVVELLDVMHQRRMQEYEIIARRTPAQAIISVENTSTTLISPTLYARYSLPQLRDFVQVVHAHNKKAILHMCGHLKHLLRHIQQTGLDGIHALTPPTIGDTPFEYTLNVVGDQVTLMGILDCTVFQKLQATAAEISKLLDDVFTPRVRESNFILLVAGDGIPLPVENFLAVRDWMDKNGGR